MSERSSGMARWRAMERRRRVVSAPDRSSRGSDAVYPLKGEGSTSHRWIAMLGSAFNHSIALPGVGGNAGLDLDGWMAMIQQSRGEQRGGESRDRLMALASASANGTSGEHFSKT